MLYLIGDDLGDTFIEDFAAQGILLLEQMLARWAEFYRLYGC